MLLSTKFKTGIGVTYTVKTGEKIAAICSFCEGDGNITGKDRTTAPCPVCNGSGKEYKERVKKVHGIIRDSHIEALSPHAGAVGTKRVTYTIERDGAEGGKRWDFFVPEERISKKD